MGIMTEYVSRALRRDHRRRIGCQPVAGLYQGLQSGNGRAEAAEVFRTLVD